MSDYLCERLTESQRIEELKADVISRFDGSEKDFEDFVMENIEAICNCLELSDIQVIERQRMIHVDDFYIKPDIMVFHMDGTLTVFEVEKASSKNPMTGAYSQMNAIGQLLLYKNVLEARFHTLVRLALIDNKIRWRTYCAFIHEKLPITLLDLQDDRLFVPYNAWVKW